jgi:pimeloyl-ACP methyl ester carboxylesterase
LKAGYDFIIVEYAGYSNDPTPTGHARTKSDVINVIDFLAEHVVSDVTVVGESLGTGVASYHTSIAPPEKILLISPFTNLTDMARDRFWFYPTSLLVDNAFDNVKNLSNYRGQVTIIHGGKDNLSPLELSQELYDSIQTEKEFILVEQAGHNDLFWHNEAFVGLNDFLLP